MGRIVITLSDSYDQPLSLKRRTSMFGSAFSFVYSSANNKYSKEARDYFNRVEAQGGSFDQVNIASIYNPDYVKGKIDAAFRQIKLRAGLWDKIEDMGLSMGVTFDGLLVKVKARPGTSLLTNTQYVSANLSSVGAAPGLLGAVNRSLGSGITASLLNKTNFSIGVLRTAGTVGSTASNMLGTGEVFTGLGIIRSNDSKVGNYAFDGAVGAAMARTGAYLHKTTGTLALDGGATVKLYQSGLPQASAVHSGGAFAASEIKVPNRDDTGRNAAYWIGLSMDEGDHAVMSNALETLAIALGWTGKQTARRINCIGDSLTYGYSTGFTQVTSPYFSQLATAQGWNSSNTDMHMLGTVGVMADTVLTNLTNYTRLTAPWAAKNVAIVWLGVNDAMNSSASAATILARLQAIGAGLIAAGQQVLWVTLPPDNTYVGATNLANYMSQVGAINSGLKSANFSNGTYGHGVAIIDTLTEIQNSTNTTYFLDGIHMKNALYTLIAPIIQSAYNALP